MRTMGRTVEPKFFDGFKKIKDKTFCLRVGTKGGLPNLGSLLDPLLDPHMGPLWTLSGPLSGPGIFPSRKYHLERNTMKSI